MTPIYLISCEPLPELDAYHVRFYGDEDALEALHELLCQMPKHACQDNFNGSYILAHNTLLALLPFVRNRSRTILFTKRIERSSIKWRGLKEHIG